MRQGRRSIPAVLEILTVLLTYVSYGARFIRLDAVGFIWKEPGTNCMHLKQTHAIVKLLRAVLDEAAPRIITCNLLMLPNI